MVEDQRVARNQGSTGPILRSIFVVGRGATVRSNLTSSDRLLQKLRTAPPSSYSVSKRRRGGRLQRQRVRFIATTFLSRLTRVLQPAVGSATADRPPSKPAEVKTIHGSSALENMDECCLDTTRGNKCGAELGSNPSGLGNHPSCQFSLASRDGKD